MPKEDWVKVGERSGYLNTTITDHYIEIRDLEDDRSNMISELAYLKLELYEIDEQIKECRDRARLMQAEFGPLKKKLDRAIKQAAKEVKQQRMPEGYRVQLGERYEYINTTITDHKNSIDSLEHERDVIISKITSSIDKLDSIDKQIKEHRDRARLMQVELDQLKKKMDRAIKQAAKKIMQQRRGKK